MKTIRTVPEETTVWACHDGVWLPWKAGAFRSTRKHPWLRVLYREDGRQFAVHSENLGCCRVDPNNQLDRSSLNRLLYIEQFTLTRRSTGGAYLGQASFPEAVAFVAGEPWTSRPRTVSPVLTGFIRRLGLVLDDEERQDLKALIPFLLGTKGTKEEEERRAWRIVDWQFRHVLPTWLRLVNLKVMASALEEAPAIAGHEDLQTIRRLLDDVQQHVAGLYQWTVTHTVQRIVERSGSTAASAAIEYLGLDPKLHDMKYQFMELAQYFCHLPLGTEREKFDVLTANMFAVRTSAEELVSTLTPR